MFPSPQVLAHLVSNKNLPPSPSRLPILGNIHQLGLVPHRDLRSLAQKHGPTMLLHFGSVPTLVLSSADASREVMIVQDTIFCDRPHSRKKYSEEGSEREFKKLLKQFLELLGSYSFADFVPWLGWVDGISGLDAEVDRVSKKLDEIQKETTHGISVENDTVKAILVDIYAAGTAITATILEWAMSELFRHPYAMSTVQRKMREILGFRPELTDGDLEKMQHLRAVIKETLQEAALELCLPWPPMQKFDWKLPDGRNREDLDTSERPSAGVQRKVPFLAVATSCCC
ncbi:hypothetical protein POM88_038756 [Heracleum sosnowskyi]|uniref:Uncharacterized protein n=1 Tax=Heracleum sosnowskyi TaxID=360622 RepID=A0AAD8M5T3_9APIA|nr:hypothetical protein POM88_038756 [Heracleum sosnowskyi]